MTAIFGACVLADSGSFNPCPVSVHTMFASAGSVRSGQVAQGSRWGSTHRINPATEAMLPGSAKTPSRRASHDCASRISASVTMSIAPAEPAMASSAPDQLAGFPMQMAVAMVSGFSIRRR